MEPALEFSLAGYRGRSPDRKFTIQSDFGQARQRRSRKNRPCDACRRRKTACIIPLQPPCEFCVDKGFECISSGLAERQSSSSSAIRGRSTHVSNNSNSDSDNNDTNHVFINLAVSPDGSETMAQPMPMVLDTQQEYNPCFIDIEASPDPTESMAQPMPMVLDEQQNYNHIALPQVPQVPSLYQGSDTRMGYMAYQRQQQQHQQQQEYQQQQQQEYEQQQQHQQSPEIAHQSQSSSSVVAWEQPTQPSMSPGTTVSTIESTGPVASREVSLHDIGDKVIHCLGPHSEQDSCLLAAFRPVIVNETDNVEADVLQVFSGAGISPYHKPPVHFLLMRNEMSESTKLAMREASVTIEAAVMPHAPDLIRLYFKHVHPAYPVVNKLWFLTEYAADKNRIPASLRGAIYSLASCFWDREPSLRGKRLNFTQEQLANDSLSVLRREFEAPSMYKLQACLLLLHTRPSETETAETATTWILASEAVAAAQMMGLHRNPDSWNIPLREKYLRKKLWWLTFAADCWSATCHGNPPHIGLNTFDTQPVEAKDMQCDEDIPESLWDMIEPADRTLQPTDCARFLEFIKITRHLRDIIECSFQAKTNAAFPNATAPREHLVAVAFKTKDWPTVIPSYLSQGLAEDVDSAGRNAAMHLAYYATQVLLFRGLMEPASQEAMDDPNSNMRRWFPQAFEAMRSFTVFMTHLTEIDFKVFWTRHARTQFLLCGDWFVYLFFFAKGPQEVKAVYELASSFHSTLQKLSMAPENLECRVILRPCSLRIDTFFAVGAEELKAGRMTDAVFVVNLLRARAASSAGVIAPCS